jgi:predicted secreted hydrolase
VNTARRLSRLAGAVVAITPLCAAAEPPAYPEVRLGYTMTFPRDFGSHPQFRTEWWYITGWLTTPQGAPLGFQITFFRTRPPQQQDNPSAFAARQLLIAHTAISDAARGRLWLDQRIRRAGLNLAEAKTEDTNVWIDDWLLRRAGDAYLANIAADGFALNLTLRVTQSPLLNGESGYSQKGPAPQSASYYYSEPHLQVSGTVVRAGRGVAVNGEAWLDHEWSSASLDPEASGWDWIGINLNDGGALTAFQIRGRQGGRHWVGATLRDTRGQAHAVPPTQIEFTPRRRWRSERTGIGYPVSWHMRVGTREFDLEPLMDDQENDTRLSSGTIYWEGAVRAIERGQLVGRGYLELTGYDKPLDLNPW